MATGLVAITLCSVKIFSIDLTELLFHHEGTGPTTEMRKAVVLHSGDPIPQIFTAKVPITNYTHGQLVGFEIVDIEWPHPFWRFAVVRDGYAYCDFGVGNPQDTGKIYRISGRRLPAGVMVPSDVPLTNTVPGEEFYGPALHRRL